MKKLLILILLSTFFASCATDNYCFTYGSGWSTGRHKAPHD